MLTDSVSGIPGCSHALYGLSFSKHLYIDCRDSVNRSTEWCTIDPSLFLTGQTRNVSSDRQTEDLCK